MVVTIYINLLISGVVSAQYSQIDSLIQIASKFDQDSPEYLDNAQKIRTQSDHLNYTQGIAKGNMLFGEYFRETKNFDSSAYYYQQAIDLFTKLNDEPKIGLAYSKLGNVFENSHQRIKAIEAYNKSIAIDKKHNEYETLSYTYVNKGYCCWKLGMYDSAEVAYLNAVEFSDLVGAERRKGIIYNNVAILYYNWAQYESAINYYRMSLEIRKKYNDFKGLALVYNNIGRVHIDIGQYNQANINFSNAMSYAILSQDNAAIGYTNNSFGILHFRQEHFDSALYYYNKSLKNYNEDDNYEGLLLNYKDIGDTFLELNKTEFAEEYIKRSLMLAEKGNYLLSIAENNMLLGKLALTKKEYKSAIERSEKALEICQQIKNQNIAKDAHLVIAKTYEALSDLDKALKHYKQFLTASHEVINTETAKKIIEMEKTTEAAKNRSKLQEQQLAIERQKIYTIVLIIFIFSLIILSVSLFVYYRKTKKVNVLLQEKNEQIHSQAAEIHNKNIELKNLVDTKNKLFSIIAHDLKNPFFSILGYSQILKNDYLSLTENEKVQFIDEISVSLHNTYQMLENLLHWSKKQIESIEPHPTEFSLNNIIQTALKHIKVLSEIKSIRFNLSIPEHIKMFADQDMTEIVFRNLVTNAVKFSYESGEINISARQSNNSVFISIEDFGIGMKKETIKDFLDNSSFNRSRTGTQGEKGTGLGLVLTKEFIEENGGDISIISKLNKGTKITIKLPAANS